jgi:PHP family Zn ribbon phosphoesterase
MEIVCPKCDTINLHKSYCTNCGTKIGRDINDHIYELQDKVKNQSQVIGGLIVLVVILIVFIIAMVNGER